MIDPSSISLVEVVDVPEVFIADTRAHTGHLQRPSRQQLLDTFDTFHFEEIFAFMCDHGHLQPAKHHGDLKGNEKG